MPFRVAAPFSRTAARKARSLLEYTRPLADRYWGEFDVFSHYGLQNVLNPEVLGDVGPPPWLPAAPAEALAAEREPLAAIQQADLHGYLPDELLTKVDIASMAQGLECRSPLLDHKLVEFAASLPAELKTHPMHSKYLLKELAARYVPREIIYRPKQGFSPPLRRWLDTSLKDVVEDLLLRGQSSSSGYFQHAGIARLLAMPTENRRTSSAVWRLLMFELWHRRRPGTT